MRGFFRRARADEGQGLAEGAIVFAVLALILLGLVDLALLYQTFIGVTNAASEGAAYASAQPGYSATNIEEAVMAERGLFRCRNLSITSAEPTPDEFGMPEITVTVRCQVADLLLIPQSLHHLTLTRSATRRMLQ